MHTGLPVGRHGLYEWHVYEPSLRRVTPLLSSFAEDTARDTLATNGFDVQHIFP
jgi:hypothetical protein